MEILSKQIIEALLTVGIVIVTALHFQPRFRGWFMIQVRGGRDDDEMSWDFVVVVATSFHFTYLSHVGK